jgi:hypothetical protein
MNAHEAMRAAAATVKHVMIDLAFTEAEAERAEELIVRGSTEALRNSILADIIEPGGLRYRLFAEFGDPEAARLLRIARESGASVSTSCTLLDATQAAWRRLWGELGMPEGPSSESY